MIKFRYAKKESKRKYVQTRHSDIDALRVLGKRKTYGFLETFGGMCRSFSIEQASNNFLVSITVLISFITNSKDKKTKSYCLTPGGGGNISC